MAFLMPKQQTPPPPPAPQLASTSIMQDAASERETLASAEGEGSQNPTGGQGVKAPNTTKSLLGS